MERILIVDDEEPFREIMCDILSRHGYECSHVPNGADALKLLDAGEAFDLITCDIVNFPMDGFEFREHMRRRFPGIPILVHTAAPDIGYTHYLSKSHVGPDDLVGAVRRALHK